MYTSTLIGNYVVLEYKTINKVTILKYIIKPIVQLFETVLQTNIKLKNNKNILFVSVSYII